MSQAVYSGLPIQTNALWTWDQATNPPVLEGYYKRALSKTGIMPSDLKAFCGVPLVRYGRPPQPVPDAELMDHIRSAEDMIEQDTGCLLCPTAVASPPTRNEQQALAAFVIGRGPGGAQVQGIDYDLADAAYDFKFDRAQEDGWLIQSMRYKPLRIFDDSTTAIKQISYNYPLLADFFRIPPTWYVEDLDFGLVRIVPSVNVTMLPLFALQLSVQGYSNSVPGGIWYQYTAGLTPLDYQTRFRFIRELVLCRAAQVALMTLQGTVNQGLESSSVLQDGVQTQFKYRTGGAYKDLIDNFKARDDSLTLRAINQVGGLPIEVL